MIYRYTYKTVCLKGSMKDHYYFGQHTTEDLNDDYCGSGLKICRYFKKYGKIEGETYIKDIISFYNSQEELNKAEYELIGDKYETDPLCLNLRAGGMQCGWSQESKTKMSNSMKKHTGWQHKEETKKKQSESAKKHPPNALGHKDPEWRKQKRRNSLKGHKSASKDKVWINNGVKETYIDIKEIENYDGWTLGRLKLGKKKVWNEDHTKYYYKVST